MAYINRGDAYIALKDTDRGLADMTKGIELEPQQSRRICGPRCCLCQFETVRRSHSRLTTGVGAGSELRPRVLQPRRLTGKPWRPGGKPARNRTGSLPGYASRQPGRGSGFAGKLKSGSRNAVRRLALLKTAPITRSVSEYNLSFRNAKISSEFLSRRSTPMSAVWVGNAGFDLSTHDLRQLAFQNKRSEYRVVGHSTPPLARGAYETTSSPASCSLILSPRAFGPNTSRGLARWRAKCAFARGN